VIKLDQLKTNAKRSCQSAYFLVKTWTMTVYDNKQFTLNDKGEIFWQALANNPMPGVAVAKLIKGDALLKPRVTLLEPSEEGHEKITEWLDSHIDEKLKPLMQLHDENLTGATKEIAAALYETMGVAPRAGLEDVISKLDDQGRAQLRFKKIRLGPILAFMPELNKPAAIKLRTILWGIWHDQTLPIAIPADGVVSQVITDKDIDKDLYQAIGYPVYGPRAVRIDMLDRVVVDLYDSSKEWKFQAKHQYCEWLGCTIDDLYLVLQALGHERIKSDTPVEEGAPAQLDWFNLRRGKMSGDAKEKKVFVKKDKPKAVAKPKPKKPVKAVKPKGPITHSFTVKGDQKDQSSNPFAVLERLKNK
jgi:ATP-dependent RNA helicase SUPV3L1/SUV3